MLGLFALNPNGVNGGVLQMINHGLFGALFLWSGLLRTKTYEKCVRIWWMSHVMPGYCRDIFGMVMTAIGLRCLLIHLEFSRCEGHSNPIHTGPDGQRSELS